MRRKRYWERGKRNGAGRAIVHMVYKALRSAGGFRRPLRSLTKKMELNVNEADREVRAFWCKPTTSKCQERHAPG